MAIRISHGRTFGPRAGGGPRPEGRPMKNSAKRDAHGGQGDKDAPKTGKTGSSAEKYAQMAASGPKKMASMPPPPHPPVTQAGGTRTNPTPSGGYEMGGTRSTPTPRAGRGAHTRLAGHVSNAECTSTAQFQSKTCLHEEGFEVRTFGGIWRNWPPQSGALAHVIAYGREIIPKKNRHSRSVPLHGVCVA